MTTLPDYLDDRGIPRHIDEETKRVIAPFEDMIVRGAVTLIRGLSDADLAVLEMSPLRVSAINCSWTLWEIARWDFIQREVRYERARRMKQKLEALR